MFRINKQKCAGCGICVSNCSGATQITSDGKAVIIDQKKLEECGGKNVCPFGAIERNLDKIKTESFSDEGLVLTKGGLDRGTEIGIERGMGRGMGQGMGQGLRRGPRDGRGGGRGYGRRKQIN